MAQQLKPAISVITPVYNSEDFVKRSYFLLKNQSFTDWEWVVVNDGSTDKTDWYLKDIDDPRVRLISYPQNKGRGYARKTALENCRGDWLVVWDVDDVYFPDRLENINNARLDGYDFCCSYVVLIDNDLNIKGVRTFHLDQSGTTKIFVHPSMACKTELAQIIGYDPNLSAGEDAAIIISLARKYNGLWIKDALSAYQEDREVNIKKSIQSNTGQFITMKLLYRKGIFDISSGEYAKMCLKWNLKLLALRALQLSPSLYLKTVSRRKNGSVESGWKIPETRLNFLHDIRRRHFANDWQTEPAIDTDKHTNHTINNVIAS